MNITSTVLQGDSSEVLKTLPEKSVDCIVTSPPYYGLRDYGTGEWVGGDPDCPHYRTTKYSENTATGHKSMMDQGEAVGDAIYKTVCPICGAVRIDKQIGLEETPEEFINKLVNVFRECKRVLKDDGTLWVNIGDSYNTHGGTVSVSESSPKQMTNRGSYAGSITKYNVEGCKPKDLIGIPWMLAFALRSDGWYLRQDIIWHKPNPMPESVTDRCTKSHEYIFLLSKKPKYYFDHDAMLEEADPKNKVRYKSAFFTGKQQEEFRPDGSTNSMGMKEYTGKRNKRDVWESAGTGIRFGGKKYGDNDDPHFATKSGKEWIPQVKHKNLQEKGQQNHSMHERRAEGIPDDEYIVRNKRDVWSVTTKAVKEAHFATFPEDLIEPCILAGSRINGTVLDPFCGSGTTGIVSVRNERNFIGIELNPEYAEMSIRRIEKERAQGIQMTLEV